ncbi:hypothetical protein [Pseudomonas nitroreducens]|uniref:hypothetical protein n=1 Tax=Pseudomonas nitroreducens TaxID=46680 RepID=UPI00209EBA52|nr:hypothetical protein [Pseudomonas nitroreducens]MCP1625877.1 hypothetical protein [Pseudomonas nitroreducens]
MPASDFPWLAVVFAMLTGLGVTRLLSNGAAAMRSRAVAKLDWLPILWSASIFLTQLDYWWALYELKETVPQWTYPAFLQLLISPLALFFAAAMVMPSSELKPGESHREIFESHGHWALIALFFYHVEGVVESMRYWHEGVLAKRNVLMMVFALLPLAAFFGNRLVQYLLVSTYLVLSVLLIFFSIDDLI